MINVTEAGNILDLLAVRNEARLNVDGSDMRIGDRESVSSGMVEVTPSSGLSAVNLMGMVNRIVRVTEGLVNDETHFVSVSRVGESIEVSMQSYV